MVVYSFYIFDRHGKSLPHFPSVQSLQLIYPPAECIYKKHWPPRPTSNGSRLPRSTSDTSGMSNGVNGAGRYGLSAEDDAKLIFGTIFSLRNMVRKLGGPEDKYATPNFISIAVSRENGVGPGPNG